MIRHVRVCRQPHITSFDQISDQADLTTTRCLTEVSKIAMTWIRVGEIIGTLSAKCNAFILSTSADFTRAVFEPGERKWKK